MPSRPLSARIAPTTRIVLDTNVALSVFAFTNSRLAPVRQLAQQGDVLLMTNEPCFAEFVRVLGYPQIRLTAEQQAEHAESYRALAQWVAVPLPGAEPAPAPLPKCRDRDDQKFLELARDCEAQLLASADARVLGMRHKPAINQLYRIVTPDELLLAVSFESV